MISNKEEFQRKILDGAKQISEYVGTTLGPHGRTVLLEDVQGTIATKDGNTVAKSFFSDDLISNVAVKLIKQGSQQTNDLVGDGTTSTTVLAVALLEELNKFCSLGYSRLDLKEQLSFCKNKIEEILSQLSIEVKSEEEIFNIAKISANGDEEIAKIVSESIDRAGAFGSIIVGTSKNSSTYVEFKEGFRFDSGYLTEKFVNNKDKMLAEYNEASWVLVTDKRFGSNPLDIRCLEWAAKENRPIIVVADDFDTDGPGFGAALHNFLQGKVKVCLVRAPRFGEEKKQILEDLCVATGATLVSNTSQTVTDFDKIKPEHFGLCQKFTCSRFTTILAGSNGSAEKIAERIEGIRCQMAETDLIGEQNKFSERISRLSSGVVEIFVGGLTFGEIIEKKHRVEDAIGAVRSCLDSGYVVGGTLTYYKILNCLAKEKFVKEYTSKILQNSVDSLLKKLCTNSGVAFDLVRQKMNIKKNFGFNFRQNKFQNLLENNVIEPTKLVLYVLLNSLTVAELLFYSEAAIINER